MVEDASGANQAMAEGRINVRFRKLQVDEDPALATCNILVSIASRMAEWRFRPSPLLVRCCATSWSVPLVFFFQQSSSSSFVTPAECHPDSLLCGCFVSRMMLSPSRPFPCLPPSILTRLSRPPPLHLLQVMEYCDKASLRHAMKKGVFHKRLDNTSVAVDLCAIVQVRPALNGGRVRPAVTLGTSGAAALTTGYSQQVRKSGLDWPISSQCRHQLPLLGVQTGPPGGGPGHPAPARPQAHPL